ncbi:MAG: TIGR03000 domain-containing protein [Planctomycetia bacterium]|nr:TIGR03000 domain-containing protein [Planctomycetia bacterium]
MSRIQKFVVLSAMLVTTLAFGTQSASAHWGWGPFRCGPACCGPFWGRAWGACCYGVCDPCCAPCVAPMVTTVATTACCDPCVACGPVCSSGYVLGWRPGPIRRLLFGRYRWYNTGYWGGWGYPVADCCGGYADGTVVEDGAVNVAPAPAAPVDKKPSVVEPSPNDDLLKNTRSTGPIYHQASYLPASQEENVPVPENSGLLKIYVPIDAKVFVNDRETSTDGSIRSFVSYGLQKGNEYDYEVRAEVVRNGQKYVETKVVTLTAGANQALAFGFEVLNPGASDVYLGY